MADPRTVAIAIARIMFRPPSIPGSYGSGGEQLYGLGRGPEPARRKLGVSASSPRLARTLLALGATIKAHYSNGKTRFQSFFMPITFQPFFFASSSSAGVKVPTLLSGRPCAGP